MTSSPPCWFTKYFSLVSFVGRTNQHGCHVFVFWFVMEMPIAIKNMQVAMVKG
jgi:hypothetical protein